MLPPDPGVAQTPIVRFDMWQKNSHISYTMVRRYRNLVTVSQARGARSPGGSTWLIVTEVSWVR